MRGCYMITKITSGSVVEKIKSYIGERSNVRSQRRKGTSTEKKQLGNRNHAILQLTRTINCNYQPGDLWLTLKFDEEHLAKCGGDFDGAKREGKKCIDRMAYQLKKQGVALKWIFCPSEIDGDTGELVRPHIHLILPKKGFDLNGAELSLNGRSVADIWGQGSIDVQLLRNQEDYRELSVYLIRQSRNVPDEKKYSCSRNMIKPKVERYTVMGGGALRVPNGAKVLDGTIFNPEAGQNFIRYIPAKKKTAAQKVGGHKEITYANEADEGGGDDGL